MPTQTASPAATTDVLVSTHNGATWPPRRLKNPDPVTIVSCRLAGAYHTTADNTNPGAWVVKAQAPTKQEADTKALQDAQVLFEKVKKNKLPTGCLSVPGF